MVYTIRIMANIGAVIPTTYLLKCCWYKVRKVISYELIHYYIKIARVYGAVYNTISAKLQGILAALLT